MPTATEKNRLIVIDSTNLYVPRLPFCEEALDQELRKGGAEHLQHGAFASERFNSIIGGKVWRREEFWIGKGYNVDFHTGGGSERNTSGSSYVDGSLATDGRRCMGDMIAANAELGVNTLALVSGDGNTNGRSASFISMVCLAIALEWRVRIYSWQGRLSGNYLKLREMFPDLVTVIYLDGNFTTPRVV